ncbi:hypothetical protein PP504_gp30 [Gordonia phage Dolores]|uniref:Uncharacterized protein n=1 Tax=Gordonia phage Dolores TaxID=2873534 RepID=A0AAE9BM38_9CAUD|nr:hypothetical protein PP504_gp30 [Gordonia phage Dolores]UAJ16461.1 hypothetical protein SEA_DOLORES_30 [Gordonia phage Dolores]
MRRLWLWHRRYLLLFGPMICLEGIEGPSGWGEACACRHDFHGVGAIEDYANQPRVTR